MNAANALEVFAEAYLATVAVEKAKHVWPGANVPHSLRKRLALTIGDKGVDGIFETQLANTCRLYQAKFRTGRPSLTWDELSTFIGLADRVKQRVLFTNCERFADVVKQRTGFYAITGNDLENSSRQDFLHSRVARRAQNRTLNQRFRSASSRSSRQHSARIAQHDRVTALMACGTGKTLVAFGLPSVSARRTFSSLFPRLPFASDVARVGAGNVRGSLFAHLCVCSDPTVKPDSDELFSPKGSGFSC